MSENRMLLLATAALSFYCVGCIWHVQISSYPLWTYVGPREFHDYHNFWWRSIWGVILFPAGLVFLGSAAMLWWQPPNVPVWAVRTGFAFQLLVALLTAVLWAPLQANLEARDGGMSMPLYHKLITTHWVRVILVTAHGVLMFWMLSRNIPGKGGPRW